MYRDAFADLRMREDEIRRIVIANAREREAREATLEARESSVQVPSRRDSSGLRNAAGDTARWLSQLLRSGVSGLVRPLGL